MPRMRHTVKIHALVDNLRRTERLTTEQVNNECVSMKCLSPQLQNNSLLLLIFSFTFDKSKLNLLSFSKTGLNRRLVKYVVL